jgi:hypothetical protein
MKRLNLRGNAPLEVLPFQLGMYDDLAWLDVTGCNINSPPPVIIQRGVRPIIDYLRRLYDGQVKKRLSGASDSCSSLPLSSSHFPHTNITQT